MPVRQHGAISRHRRIVIWASVAMAIVAISSIFSAGLSPASAYFSTAITKHIIARLGPYALAVARQNGDPRPASARAVKTTQKMALGAVTPSNTVPHASSRPVYLIVMTGNFTVNAGPPGGRAPTGKYMSIIIDAQTFKAIGLGLSNRPPAISLRRLGEVSVLTQYMTN